MLIELEEEFRSHKHLRKHTQFKITRWIMNQ